MTLAVLCVVKGRLLRWGAQRRGVVLMRTDSFFGWMNPLCVTSSFWERAMLCRLLVTERLFNVKEKLVIFSRCVCSLVRVHVFLLSHDYE